MSLKISRILHAGYVFECSDTQIAFDPIFENPFSRNCHAFPEVRFDVEQIGQLKFAAVFISHFHDDHCSLESLDLLERTTPIHLYCLHDELFAMIEQLGFVQVHRLHTDVPVQVGPFEVIPRQALDAEVDSMFQINAAGLKVLNVVDAWIDPDVLLELAGCAPWDMVLWPFQTMLELEVLAPSRAGPVARRVSEEVIDQLRQLAPRFVVPSSCQFLQEPWSWYNHAFFPISYRQFQHDVEGALSATTVVRINPSVSFVLDGDGLQPAPALNWVIAVGEQDLDYQYDAPLARPHTADIARQFAPLCAAQRALALDYCSGALLTRYREMELPEESYFEQPRLWRLSVYDHAGALLQFFYRIEGEQIDLLERTEAETEVGAGRLAWTTDIPISKLYAALELGESLTSMYMRINDTVFADDIEHALSAAEVIDDPLIRCLFNEVFGAYQSAQLRRLSE
jgi:hypothetical protein